MQSLKICLIIGLMLCCLSSSLFSQQLSVKNVRFESNGNIVKIHYDLSGLPDKKYKISLKLSNDNGISYNIRPKTTEGDVGKNIRAGNNKEIKWNMYKDFPDGLAGDEFVFAVDAVLQKRALWPYFVAGIPIIGGAAYFATKGTEKEQSTKGSIVISVSGDF